MIFYLHLNCCFNASLSIHNNFEVNQDNNFKCLLCTSIFFSRDTVATAMLLAICVVLKCVCRVLLETTISLSNVKATEFIFLIVHAMISSLIRARLNHTSLDCTRRSVPAGTDGNGRAYQNRFKARLISRSTQIKPLALDEPSPDEQTRANVTNCIATRV